MLSEAEVRDECKDMCDAFAQPMSTMSMPAAVLRGAIKRAWTSRRSAQATILLPSHLISLLGCLCRQVLG